jgi:hypothetical protein
MGGFMRWLLGIAFAVMFSVTAFGQNSLCGKPPEFENRLENSEKMKGDLSGRAQTLFRLLGSADLSGKIEAERRELYKSSSGAEAARADAYLAYLFCMLIIDDRTLSANEKVKAIQEFRKPVVSVIPPPIVDLTPDVTTAAVTKIILSSFGQFAYSVTNAGWADDMSNVTYSLWAVRNGQVAKIDERSIGYIAKGQYAAADRMQPPFPVGKMIVCVYYEFKGKRVNVIDFYSNENASSIQRQMGEMSKFRRSVTQVDGPNDLCRSMPSAVAGLI